MYDSGVGGFTILRELLRQNVKANFIYLADNKNAPYGDKKEDDIKSFVMSNIKSINKKYKVNGIILACNTAAIVSKTLISNSLKLPTFSISEHITKLINNSDEDDVAILATNRTVRSGYFKDKSRKRIIQVGCPSFAPFIESRKFTNLSLRKVIVEKELSKKGIEYYNEIYLACTHYPFLSYEISKIFSHKIKVIDPAKTFVEQIRKDIEQKDIQKKFDRSDQCFDLKLLTTDNCEPIVSFFRREIDKEKFEKYSILDFSQTKI